MQLEMNYKDRSLTLTDIADRYNFAYSPITFRSVSTKPAMSSSVVS